jgi:hypothetical protein
MAKNGRLLVPLSLLLILRTIRGITSVTYVISGYQLTKLQLTMLLHEAEHQIYDMYSQTWPSLVARVMKPKGQRLLSSNKKHRRGRTN